MAQRTIYRYTDEEKQFILDHYWDGQQREDVCRLLEDRHTRASVHYQYYDLLKKEVRMKPAQYRALMREKAGDTIDDMRQRLQKAERFSDVVRPVLTAVPAPVAKPQIQAKSPSQADSYESEARMFSMFQSALEQVEAALEDVGAKIEAKVNARIEQQGRALATVATLMARAGSGEEIPDIAGLIEERDRVQRENEALKAQIAEQKAEYQKIYSSLNFWLGEFMGLDQVGKVTSLEDFIPRLKVIVDQFGTVQGARKQRRVIDFESLEREASDLKREAAGVR